MINSPSIEPVALSGIKVFVNTTHKAYPDAPEKNNLIK